MEKDGPSAIGSSTHYHRHTGYDRERMSGHFLDWSDRPSVYKSYPFLDAIPLPQDPHLPPCKLSDMLGGAPALHRPSSISGDDLTTILALAYSLTAQSRHSGQDFFYRSVPSAGALYPCELYLGARFVSGLGDGLYHYGIGEHSLRLLRPGTPGEPCPSPALTFFVTAIAYRSAWKYRERAYRYLLLDTGHLVGSLLLSLGAGRLVSGVNYDFYDRTINTLLGLDDTREVCLALVQVPGQNLLVDGFGQNPDPLDRRFPATSRTARREVVYGAIRQVHAVSSAKGGGGDVPNMVEEVGLSVRSWQEIARPGKGPEEISYADAVVRRRSLRNFVGQKLAGETFLALLHMLCACPAAEGSVEHAVGMGLLIGGVEGFEKGGYLLDRIRGRIGLFAVGDHRERMARVCLDQQWLTQASIHVFFAANLAVLESCRGSRGYRYAMMTAGILCQRLYVGAAALGLGCCGIGAFYDAEAACLLGLNADSAMLYLAAVGPVKKMFAQP